MPKENSETVYGLEKSYKHSLNGMTKEDMLACAQVANDLNEVIIFRSTGPWSQRWIELNYPTKNFHVKGKSSDWGPQAGFVPYLGIYSKVSGNKAKEDAGTKCNIDGLKHSYTRKKQLCLTLKELMIQRTKAAGYLKSTAISSLVPISGSRDYFVYAHRSSDKKPFAFKAVWSSIDNHFKLFVYKDCMEPNFLQFLEPVALEVMTSSEVGAMNKPMTGDYDLMAVCPSWADYGSRTPSIITKPGINFGRAGGAEPGQTFEQGTNMDAVLDMRTNTGLKGGINAKGQYKTYGANGFTASGYGKLVRNTPNLSAEHVDMGNITPRILRCINYLNAKMGQSGPFRRVHHNAESHRNAIFGGMTENDMERGEAFPLTIFQPQSLLKDEDLAKYETVSTLVNIDQFRTYAKELHKGGYYLPRNWTWGMSIRNTH